MKTVFCDRSAIAEYLRISRMTLYRYEKILPLTNRFKGSHIKREWLTMSEVDQWKKELRQKAYDEKIYIEF